MAKASNISVAHSNIIPQTAAGRICTWLTEWTLPGGGEYLGRLQVSNSPPALFLGERYSIPVGAIVKIQSGYSSGTQLPTDPVAGQIFQFTASASSLQDAYNYNGTSSVSSTSSGNVFVYNGGRWIRQSSREIISYESEEQAVRSLQGRILGGLWYQCHDNDPGVMGIENIIPNIHRLGIHENSWLIEKT